MAIACSLCTNTPIFSLIIGIFGLLVGSFLNVVIYRLPIMIENNNGEHFLKTSSMPVCSKIPFNLWWPRSFCIFCRQPIAAWLTIPVVSYILLKGKASCCQQLISGRYPLVEFLTGTLSFLLAWHLGATVVLIWSLILSWALIGLFFIDINTLTLPDQINLPLLWLGLLINDFSTFTNLHNAVLGAMVGYLFSYIIAWLILKVRKIEGLGQGDIKLIAMLGAWFGWQLLPAIVFIASLTGSIIGIIYIISKKQKFTANLPFGPFLATAGLLTLFWGNEIINLQFLLTKTFSG